MEPTLAVIVCRHIAEKTAPVKWAVRSQPLQKEDSGWQFLCRDCHATPDGAKVWAVHEIIEYDHDVSSILDFPADVSLDKVDDMTASKHRRLTGNPWHVSHCSLPGGDLETVITK